MKELTNHDIIERIDGLIEEGIGDPGRLDNIRESLRKGKTLFNSDMQYLENLLGPFVQSEPKEIHPDPLLPMVEKLIEAGTGDPGRLQSIHDSLLKGKPLFHSDENYLKKLEESSL